MYLFNIISGIYIWKSNIYKYILECIGSLAATTNIILIFPKLILYRYLHR